MSSKLAKHAYEQLIAEDIAWLRLQPACLEREHIEVVLNNSIQMHYPTAPPVAETPREPERCPTCNSYDRHLHPMEPLSEHVTICQDRWHTPFWGQPPAPLTRAEEAQPEHFHLRADGEYEQHTGRLRDCAACSKNLYYAEILQPEPPPEAQSEEPGNPCTCVHEHLDHGRGVCTYPGSCGCRRGRAAHAPGATGERKP